MILAEEAIAKGTRRIVALTGSEADRAPHQADVITLYCVYCSVVPVFCIMMLCGEYWVVVNKHMA